MPYKLVNAEESKALNIVSFNSGTSCYSLIYIEREEDSNIQLTDKFEDSIAKFPVLGAALHLVAQGKPVVIGTKITTAMNVANREGLSQALSYLIEATQEVFITNILYTQSSFRLLCEVHTLNGMRRLMAALLAIAIESSNISITKTDQVGKES